MSILNVLKQFIQHDIDHFRRKSLFNWTIIFLRRSFRLLMIAIALFSTLFTALFLYPIVILNKENIVQTDIYPHILQCIDNSLVFTLGILLGYALWEFSRGILAFVYHWRTENEKCNEKVT